MITGQASGVAASMALKTGKPVQDVDTAALSAKLKSQGGIRLDATLERTGVFPKILSGL